MHQLIIDWDMPPIALNSKYAHHLLKIEFIKFHFEVFLNE